MRFTWTISSWCEQRTGGKYSNIVSNKHESLKKESLKQKKKRSVDLFTKDDCSSMTQQQISQISPFLHSLFENVILPSCQICCFFELWSPSKCFPALSTLPWGLERQNTWKWLISGWIVAHVDYSDRRRVYNRLNGSHMARIMKCVGGGGGLCLSALSLFS